MSAHWTCESNGRGQAIFRAEGIRCANCAHKIEHALAAMPGVIRAAVNIASGRVHVEWHSRMLRLDAILARVAQLGFTPAPLAGRAALEQHRRESRQSLKRLGLAGLGSMQVMMYATGLYTGAFSGIDPEQAQLLRLVCLAIATPVLFYSGAPILRGALADLRQRTLGMDVNVSIALLLAYVASAWNTLRGSGEVYFDSVTMFVFFLLVGRHLDYQGRRQAIAVGDALAAALPPQVVRESADGTTESVGPQLIRDGDVLHVGRNEVIAVDSVLLSEYADVDEALVTGESALQRKSRGAALLGGSINGAQPITVRARGDAGTSTLHQLVGLLERAQSERPRLGLAAQRIASRFILSVMILTVITGVVWSSIDPARVLPAMLAVLVVTCPCALSLATPMALAAATSSLARDGVLVTRADALEKLAHVDTVVLDKTGTLTSGAAGSVRVECLGDIDEALVAGIARALERHSRHPLALALSSSGGAPAGSPDPLVSEWRDFPGAGIEARVHGELWRIGRAEFVRELAPGAAASDRSAGATAVLGDRTGLHAAFHLTDVARPESADAVRGLAALGLAVRIASGDRPPAVAGAAHALAIPCFEASMLPEEKLARVRALQSEGHRVLMVGDGINDGPVLAAADVSVAMAAGSSIAHAAADVVLLRDTLLPLPRAIALARRTLQIMRQNLAWAFAYNIAAVPLAALGLVPPWVAALGMSASSLLVVLNARRLTRPRGATPPDEFAAREPLAAPVSP